MARSLNLIRCKWAESALERHDQRLGKERKSLKEEEEAERIASLICNLNHFADSKGLDMSEILEQAGEMYEQEVDDE